MTFNLTADEHQHEHIHRQVANIQVHKRVAQRSPPVVCNLECRPPDHHGVHELRIAEDVRQRARLKSRDEPQDNARTGDNQRCGSSAIKGFQPRLHEFEFLEIKLENPRGLPLQL